MNSECEAKKLKLRPANWMGLCRLFNSKSAKWYMPYLVGYLPTTIDMSGPSCGLLGSLDDSRKLLEVTMKWRISRVPCYGGSITACKGSWDETLGIFQDSCRAVGASECYIRVALMVKKKLREVFVAEWEGLPMGCTSATLLWWISATGVVI